MPCGTTVLRPSLPPWKLITNSTRSLAPGKPGSAVCASACEKIVSVRATTASPETAPRRNPMRFIFIRALGQLVRRHCHGEVGCAAHALVDVLRRELRELGLFVSAQGGEGG